MSGVAILGSTGSIGRQTLSVCEHLGLRPVALTAGKDAAALEEQARRYRPRVVAIADKKAGADLTLKLADLPVKVLVGLKGLEEAAAIQEADTVVAAIVGMAGLAPVMAALEAGKRVALANKEALVCAGEHVLRLSKEKKAPVLPVDSEHSAIFQCLQAGRPEEVSRLWLTSSGGPFWGYSRKQLEVVTPEQALRHPNWSMGAKITIDSATLMNKGLECIEAMHLFGFPMHKISVVIHRQSLVHSCVAFCDGAVMAQMGAPDMRAPIQYALTYPERKMSPMASPDLTTWADLTFAPPDSEAFGCLRLAIQAAEKGGTAPAVLNAANEEAVALFLDGKISFLQIEMLIEKTLAAVYDKGTDLDAIRAADKEARIKISEFLK